MIQVALDHDGVRTAALELLCEPTIEFENDRLRKQAEGSGNAERILQGVKPTRSLSEGYYARAQYLLWLRQRLRIGVISPEQVKASDADGLLAIDGAIRDFQHHHWQCPSCATWWELEASTCGKCGFDPRKREG